jgi:RNA polymerase sigma-70 factor, ECF subfamily
MDRHQPPDQGSADTALGQAWRDHRRYLLDVAYRMLGSVNEAEDIVQESFARLLRVDPATIDDLRGWLVAVTSRLCLDQLRSARSRRETYVGPWLPEPLIPPEGGSIDPADQVTLDDSVRMALLVVLERLTPAERTAFVLHDVFQFSFDAVGSIIGRSPAACRQLASRARHRIQADGGPARSTVEPAEQRRVAERFIAAASGGDLDALMQLLDPDAVGETDTGGLIPGPHQPIVGRVRVAKSLLQALKAGHVTLVPMLVNGQPGAIAMRDGRVAAVFALTVQDGLIQHIHAIANPYKLAYVTWMLQRNP